MATVLCTGCGAENPARTGTRNYCKKCGRLLKEDVSALPSARSAGTAPSSPPTRTRAKFWGQVLGIGLVIVGVSIYGHFRKSTNMQFTLLLLYGVNILCAIWATVVYQARIVAAVLAGLTLGAAIFLGILIYDAGREVGGREPLLAMAVALPAFVAIVLGATATIRTALAGRKN